jgi:hypothetical protein
VSYEARLAPDEIEVYCIECNAKLFNASIYDGIKSGISCPQREKCKKEAEDARLGRRYRS